MDCGKGEFYRKSYTRYVRRTGKRIRVPGKCIRSQTRYVTPLRVDRTRMRGFRLSNRTLTKPCPSGFVPRAAYVRYTKKGKHIRVPDHCIRDRGNPGKGYRGGPGIGPLRKGELAEYGYSNVVNLSVEQRHEALRNAIQVYGSLGVWRKLNAVAIYTKHTAPSSSAIFLSDRNWVRETYGIKAFS